MGWAQRANENKRNGKYLEQKEELLNDTVIESVIPHSMIISGRSVNKRAAMLLAMLAMGNQTLHIKK